MDGISGQFQALWPKLGIKHDQFIRTTDADHKPGVQAFLQKVYDNGDIYFGEHGGHYCTAASVSTPKRNWKTACARST